MLRCINLSSASSSLFVSFHKISKTTIKRKILYDHSAKQEEDKYTGSQSLKKINNSILPEYILKNLEKYKDWLD